MLKIHIVTLFPDLFKIHLDTYPISKAIKKNLLSVDLINLRGFAVNSYGSVDDRPYGGGAGMILRPEPIFEAVESIKKEKNSKVALLSPKGENYTQKKARNYSKLDQLILICGRYEGVDERIRSRLADDIVSMGDYVLSGGELPAMTITETIARLIPGVLEKEEASKIESFSKDARLEYPQYTRPEDYRGMRVPKVLLSGNHKEIAEWRKKHSGSKN